MAKDTTDQAERTDPKKVDVRELTRTGGGTSDLASEVLRWKVASAMRTWRAMRDDPVIGLGLYLVKAPLHGADWRVETDDSDVEEFVSKEIGRLWHPLMRTSLRACDFGFAPHEKLWEVRDGQVHLEKAKDLDPADSVILRDTNGDFAGFRWKGRVDVPAAKSFIFTHDKEFGDLYGRPRTVRAKHWWQFGENVRKLWGRYTERRSVPPLVGYAPAEMRVDANGTEQDCIEHLQKALEKLRAGGIAALPGDFAEDGKTRLWHVELLKDDQRATDFDKAVERSDTMKLRAVIVPERAATQGDSGTYGMAAAHAEMFLTLEDLLLFSVLEHWNRYVVDPLVLLNFGPDKSAAVVSDGLNRETRDMLRWIVEKLLINNINSEAVQEALDVVATLEGAGLPIVDEKERKRRAAEKAAQQPPRQVPPSLVASMSHLRNEGEDVRDALADAGKAEAKPLFEALVEDAVRTLPAGRTPTLDQLQQFLDTRAYADTLQAVCVSGWLHGAVDVARKLPGEATLAQDDVDRFAPADAARFLTRKKVLTSSEFNELAEGYRRFAFRIAQVDNLRLATTVRDSLAAAIAEGVEEADWTQQVRAAFDRAGVSQLSDWRLETTFRTNAMSAYAAGEWDLLHHEDVVDLFPLYRINTVADTRRSEICRDLDGITRPADDPFWLTHWPPFHHACRTTVEALDADRAGSARVTDDAALGKLTPPDAGFGRGGGSRAHWQVADELGWKEGLQ